MYAVFVAVWEPLGVLENVLIRSQENYFVMLLVLKKKILKPLVKSYLKMKIMGIRCGSVIFSQVIKKFNLILINQVWDMIYEQGF